MNRSELISILSAAQRALGLQLTYHDFLQKEFISDSWGDHQNLDCIHRKRKNMVGCVSFCGDVVHQKMASGKGVSCHTCPFGHGEITVRVMMSGRIVGVLYAGSWWQQEGRPPSADFIIRPSREWIEDRIQMLVSIASHIGSIMEKEAKSQDPRMDQIRNYLSRNLSSRVTLAQLAKHLSISSSRTGHVVRQIFGMTFPQLLQRVRLEQVARRLRFESAEIVEIAFETGFSDQSHLTRSFKDRFGVTPARYRKQHSGSP